MVQKKKNIHKFYAVSSGRRVGIFTSWNSASQAVTGCPHSSYKAYETLDQAKAAMRQAGHPEPVIFDDEDRSPTMINWAEQCEVSDERYDDMTADDMCDKDEEDNKEEEHNPDLECFCQESKQERIVKCSDCGHRIHWTCTELPLYQLCIYTHTQRKFTCKVCATKFIDDKTSEEFQRVKHNAEQAERESSSASVSPQQKTDTPDTFLSQLLVTQHQTTTAVLQNIEAAMTGLVEQIATADSFRGDVMAMLVNERQALPTSTRDVAVMTSAARGEKVDTKKTPSRQRKGTSLPTPSPPSPQQQSSHPSSPTTGKSSSPSPKLCDPLAATEAGNVYAKSAENDNNEEAADTDSSSSSDDDGDNSESGDKTKVDSSLPHLLMLHDSVLDDIDCERLGKAYGLRVTRKKNNATKNCTSHLCMDDTPDAVLLHIGVHDLTEQSAETVVKDISKEIHTLLGMTSGKVIISKLAPTKNDTLFAKVEVVNALLYAEFVAEKRVSFLSHHQLQRTGTKHLKDEMHPSLKGTGIMAGNIGRHVHSLFWEKAKQRRRNNRPHHQYNEIQSADYRAERSHYPNNRPHDTGSGQHIRHYQRLQRDSWHEDNDNVNQYRDFHYERQGQNRRLKEQDRDRRYGQQHRDRLHGQQYQDGRHGQQYQDGRYEEEHRDRRYGLQYRDRRYNKQYGDRHYGNTRHYEDDYQDWGSSRHQGSRRQPLRDQRSDYQHRGAGDQEYNYSRYGHHRRQEDDGDDDATRYVEHKDNRSHRQPYRYNDRDRQYTRWDNKHKY